MYIFRYILFICIWGILLTSKGSTMEQDFIVSYKVLTPPELQNLYQVSNQSINPNNTKENTDIYVFGYIQIHPSYKTPPVMIEITFFNPSKKAFIRSSNIGWLGGKEKRFFLIHLGSQNNFSSIDYSVKILMKK